MEEQIKNGIKRLAEDAETGIARSILRWKYKKEGVPLPEEEDLQVQSRRIANEARGVISRGGRNILNEFKKVYGNSRGKEDRER